MVERIAATKILIVSETEFIRALAQRKAAEKCVSLPSGAQPTTYDPKNNAFVITFMKDVEKVL